MESYKWMGCSIIHAVLASFAKRKKPNTEKESMKACVSSKWNPGCKGLTRGPSPVDQGPSLQKQAGHSISSRLFTGR